MLALGIFVLYYELAIFRPLKVLAMVRKFLVLSLLTQSVSAAAQSVATAAPPSSQDLQGLFVEERISGTNVAYVHYFFWSDGRYCLGLPSGGLEGDSLDFDKVQRTQPCGQYRIANQQLALTPRDGSASQNKALTQREGNRFLLDGHQTYKAPALPASQALDGEYSAFVIGSQMARQSFVFRADGTYQFASVPVTSLDGSPVSYAGSYKLVGNTLQLTGESAPNRLTAYPVKPGAIMIEGTVFSR
jgi:hypothetical protein